MTSRHTSSLALRSWFREAVKGAFIDNHSGFVASFGGAAVEGICNSCPHNSSDTIHIECGTLSERMGILLLKASAHRDRPVFLVNEASVGSHCRKCWGAVKRTLSIRYDFLPNPCHFLKLGGPLCSLVEMVVISWADEKYRFAPSLFHSFVHGLWTEVRVPRLCIGFRCHLFNQAVRVAPDGTRWISMQADSEANMTTSDLWPIHRCDELVIPTRRGFVGGTYGGHGYGTRTNTNLLYAPIALAHGLGFQMSRIVCGDDDVWKPHCLFRPIVGSCQNVSIPCQDCESNWHRFSERYPHKRSPQKECQMISQSEKCSDQSHGRVMAWRKIANVVLRLQPEIEDEIDKLLQHMPFVWEGREFGALHMRRGDKVQPNHYSSVKANGIRSEAVAYHACTYIDVLAQLAGSRPNLTVAIATDDRVRVAEELQNCSNVSANSWRIHFFSQTLSRAHSRAPLVSLWSEITVLRRATWAVGTFSSNIGRLVQVLRHQPPSTMQSLDSAWHAG